MVIEGVRTQEVLRLLLVRECPLHDMRTELYSLPDLDLTLTASIIVWYNERIGQLYMTHYIFNLLIRRPTSARAIASRLMMPLLGVTSPYGLSSLPVAPDRTAAIINLRQL